MNMKLEVVIVPVSDVDRAKAFYEELGFRLSYTDEPKWFYPGEGNAI
jgi:catechol 2,3-dioxygenase-like lactoylglutathione lyase family enzyme